MTTTTAPAAVTRYLAAAAAGDAQGVAACFTEEGAVTDEGRTYTGREEIVRWREEALSRYTYTTTVTGSEQDADGGYRVHVRVEGDFPGGVADLTFRFTLREGLVAALHIGEPDSGRA